MYVSVWMVMMVMMTYLVPQKALVEWWVSE